MFTFESAHDLHKKFVSFYEAGKLAVALCHGVAILRYAKLSNGQYLAKGKTVTGFAKSKKTSRITQSGDEHAASRPARNALADQETR